MVHHQDGLEFLRSLETNSVQLILTDPPYQISRESGMQNALENEKGDKKFRIQTKFGEWDENFGIGELEPFIQEMYRVLAPGGTLICFYDLWKLSFLANILEVNRFKQLRFIEWIKTNPVPINSKLNYLTNSREVAITAVKRGKPTFHSRHDNGLYEFPIYQGLTKTLEDGTKIKERCHPTQKSVPLFEELIRKHSNEGDLVVDPFVGSGTTYIAAKLAGRRFAGSEISETYYDSCLQRIETFYPEWTIGRLESAV